MTLTAELLHRLSGRASELYDAQQIAETTLPAIRRLPGWNGEDATLALKRVIARSEAFSRVWQAAYNHATADVRDRADRLDDMLRRPFAYSIAELVAERVALGVSLTWCSRYGRQAVAA